jgi:hypothetical protein
MNDWRIIGRRLDCPQSAPVSRREVMQRVSIYKEFGRCFLNGNGADRKKRCSREVIEVTDCKLLASEDGE